MFLQLIYELSIVFFFVLERYQVRCVYVREMRVVIRGVCIREMSD